MNLENIVIFEYHWNNSGESYLYCEKALFITFFNNLVPSFSFFLLEKIK